MIRSFNRSMLAPVLAVSVTMASCPAALADERAVKVGFAGGMTGACGSIVKSELQGVEMAIAELNAKDGILGRQVVLIKRDTQTKPDEGAKVARDLIVNEKIDVLTGVCSSSVLLAVTAVSKETRTPFYSTVGNTQKANFEAYQPYFWQTQANAWMEARAAALLVARASLNFLGMGASPLGAACRTLRGASAIF